MIIFKKANKNEIQNCFNIRLKVFVDEQGWKIDEEIDNLENECIHYLAIDGDKYIATLRVHINDKQGHIGRVCVLKEYRNQHIGSNLIKFVENDLKDSINSFNLSARTDACEFYKKLGYTVTSAPYFIGIHEHIDMIKNL